MCWLTLDPETLLMTSDAPQELIEHGVFTLETAQVAGAGIVASEYLREDVNTFGTPGPDRDPQRGHARTTRAERPVPRGARSGGDPVRAPRRVRQPGRFVGRRPHRPPRRQGRLQEGCARPRHAGSRSWSNGRPGRIPRPCVSWPPREREVAALLARGLSNAEIATRLFVPPFTVQDHVKSLFEKAGVASRQELVARIFLDDYLPHVTGRTPLSASGGFVQPDPA